MSKSIVTFYIYGLFFNLILIFLLLRINRKKNRTIYRINIKKIDRVDVLSWHERSDFLYIIFIILYLLNFLSSWISVPFNILIILANLYYQNLNESDGELQILNEALFEKRDLTPTEVFVIYHITDKNILISSLGEGDLFKILKSLAKDYNFNTDEKTLSLAVRSIRSSFP